MRNAPITLRSVLGLALAGLAACGCTPPEELDANDLGDTLEWEDILGADDDESIDAPGDLRGNVRGALPGAAIRPARAAVDPGLTPDRLALLPLALQQKPSLATLALKRGLENPVDYHGGVYGLIGPAKVFVSTLDGTNDESRLYWVMVRVLSEKYGCFMVSKVNRQDRTQVTCRDRRQIVFWRSRGPGWIQFLARQYDDAGYEIVVRKRQIIRISRERII